MKFFIFYFYFLKRSVALGCLEGLGSEPACSSPGGNDPTQANPYGWAALPLGLSVTKVFPLSLPGKPGPAQFQAGKTKTGNPSRSSKPTFGPRRKQGQCPGWWELSILGFWCLLAWTPNPDDPPFLLQAWSSSKLPLELVAGST